MLRRILKHVLPRRVIESLQRIEIRRRKAYLASFPTLSEEEFRELLVTRLGLRAGDTVFVHSSIDFLNLGFPFFRILALLHEVIGPQGTSLFPTYPQLGSYEFLRGGNVFDIRKSASYTGVVSEFARRQKGSVRSLHPTKSVCAMGRHAAELTATHPLSPYPFDSGSPYFKMMEFDGKIVGLGVSTGNMSFVHCVEDFLKSEFPINPYHDDVFQGQCLDYQGTRVTVPSLAHDPRKVEHNIPRFMKRHIPSSICEDFVIRGMKFFRADSKELFPMMVSLARRGITIYAP